MNRSIQEQRCEREMKSVHSLTKCMIPKLDYNKLFVFSILLLKRYNHSVLMFVQFAFTYMLVTSSVTAEILDLIWSKGAGVIVNMGRI